MLGTLLTYFGVASIFIWIFWVVRWMCQPVEKVEIHYRSIDAELRLRQIHWKARWHYDHLEALAEEACLVMGVDPNVESYERDVCRSTVFDSIQPSEVFKKVGGC